MVIKRMAFSFLVILFTTFQSGYAQGGNLNLQLIEASQKGDINQVKELIERGADVNVKDDRGETALMWAAMHGHKDIVIELIEREADVNVKNNDGSTALMLAALSGNKDIVIELIERGADVNAKDKYGERTALMLASMNGHKDIVKELIERGADVNAKDNYGYTALMNAVSRYKEIVKELLKRGANIDTRNETGITAIDMANNFGVVDRTNLLTQIKEIEESIENDIQVNIEGLSLDVITVLIARSVIKNNINYYDFILKLLQSLSKEEIQKIFDEDLIRQLIIYYKDPKIYNSYIKNILELVEEQLDKPELKREIRNALLEAQALQKELKRGRFSDIDIVTQE